MYPRRRAHTRRAARRRVRARTSAPAPAPTNASARACALAHPHLLLHGEDVVLREYRGGLRVDERHRVDARGRGSLHRVPDRRGHGHHRRLRRAGGSHILQLSLLAAHGSRWLGGHTGARSGGGEWRGAGRAPPRVDDSPEARVDGAPPGGGLAWRAARALALGRAGCPPAPKPTAAWGGRAARPP